jgi:Tol biopolymer transport system component
MRAITWVLLALSVFIAAPGLLWAESGKTTDFSPLPTGYSDLFAIGDTSGLSGMLVFSAASNAFDRILVLDLDGRRVRKAIDGPGNNSYPSWSPDGTKFTFTSDRDSKKEIYLAAWDGSRQTRLTKTGFTNDNASWCPDGHTIVFYSETDKPGGTANIFSMDYRNPAPQQLTQFALRNVTPRCSPDNKSVAYSTNRFWPGWDICVWSLKNRKESCLLTGAESYCRPRYSPDGASLAYSTGAFNDVDIAMADLASRAGQRITKLPGKEYDVTFSPDGRYLAFSAENGNQEIFNLYLYDTKDQRTRPLLKAPLSMRFLDWTKARSMDLEVERLRAEQDLAERMEATAAAHDDKK